MDALNLENEPMMWLPVTAFSDVMLKGDHEGRGVDISLTRNKFFRYLRYISPAVDEVALQQGMSLSADRELPEVGIVIVTREQHLMVVSEKFTSIQDDSTMVLPVLWNARLVWDANKIGADEVYYKVYCDLGMAYAVYDPASNVFWTEEEFMTLCGMR